MEIFWENFNFDEYLLKENDLPEEIIKYADYLTVFIFCMTFSTVLCLLKKSSNYSNNEYSPILQQPN